MSYTSLIQKHNLHIGNHKYVDDVCSVLNIPTPNKINASSTLHDICEAKLTPILMLRKEAFGWRFRQMFGSSKNTSGNYTWHRYEKLSMLICLDDYKWQSNNTPHYSGGKYIKTRRKNAMISASFSIDIDKFNSFVDAYTDLRLFIDSFIDEYESILASEKMRKAA